MRDACATKLYVHLVALLDCDTDCCCDREATRGFNLKLEDGARNDVPKASIAAQDAANAAAEHLMMNSPYPRQNYCS